MGSYVAMKSRMKQAVKKMATKNFEAQRQTAAKEMRDAFRISTKLAKKAGISQTDIDSETR